MYKRERERNWGGRGKVLETALNLSSFSLVGTRVEQRSGINLTIFYRPVAIIPPALTAPLTRLKLITELENQCLKSLMRRSNRCRWISFLSPPVSFSSSFSEFNRIRNNFFLLLSSIFLSSFPSSKFFLLQTILSFFQNKICSSSLFDPRKFTQNWKIGATSGRGETSRREITAENGVFQRYHDLAAPTLASSISARCTKTRETYDSTR